MLKVVKREWKETILMIRNGQNHRSKKQAKDLLKMAILIPVFLVPGGTLLVILLVKYSKKVGIDMSVTKSFPS
jgi:hypothetical protein